MESPSTHKRRAPFFFNPATSPPPGSAPDPTPRPRRINPWRMFVGSMVPNWLQCRHEINQGAKLAYARLAQHAGKGGQCYPKQETLAVELGVSERTANEYVRVLVRFGLIEKERPGLGRSNRYYFLDHPWMHEGQPETPGISGQDRQETSVPDRQNFSEQDQQETFAPIVKENQGKENQRKRVLPHSPPEGDRVTGTGFISAQEEEIYTAYPKKVGKPVAVRAIRRALAKHSFEFLLERTRLYAQSSNVPAEFIPYPSTWFNQERFNDDPVTWSRTVGANGKPKPAIIRPDKFNCGVTKL